MSLLEQCMAAAKEVGAGLAQPDEWVSSVELQSLMNTSGDAPRCMVRDAEIGLACLAMPIDGRVRTWAARR